MRYTIRRVDDQHTVVEAYGFISSPVVYSTVLCFAAPVGVRGGGDVRGQLRQRAGAGRPAALAVSFGGLGCSGFIPGSPR